MVPNIEANKVLDLAERLGVEIIMLPPEVDLSYRWQKKMTKMHGVSRCPAQWPCYASFGNPETGVLGKLCIPSWRIHDHWNWDGVILLPEILLLHELAHCVVGEESNTIPWEQKHCLALWGDDSPQKRSLEIYEEGAAGEEEIREARRYLEDLGLL